MQQLHLDLLHPYYLNLEAKAGWYVSSIHVVGNSTFILGLYHLFFFFVAHSVKL